MALKPISSGLRTIHNGSNGVAKASIVVAVGEELTVPEAVAMQLQRDSAFKDGPASKALLKQAADNDAAVADAEAAQIVEATAASTPDAPAKKAAAKRPAKKAAATKR